MSAILTIILIWLITAFLLMGIYCLWFFIIEPGKTLSRKNKRIYLNEYNERLKKSRKK